MPQGDRSATRPTSALSAADAQRTGARFPQRAPTPQAFRLLSGSQHSIVCLACSAFLWGWKDKKVTP